MTIQQFIEAAEHAARYVPTATAEIITRLVQAQQQSEAQVKQLAAENAGLRETVEAVRGVANKSSGISGWHLNGEIAKWEEILPEIDDIETPATDAAIASLRAEGVDSVGEYLKQYAQGLHEEARLVMQDAGELCNGYAAQLRSQSAASPEAAAIARQFEQVKGVQS